jgi:YD repeat-containing protein
MKKSFFPFLAFSICFLNSFAQYELFDPKGSKKIKVETMNYYQNDSTSSHFILNFNSKGKLVKNTKFDHANEPVEEYSFSYKFDGAKIKYSDASFKDYTKSLKKMSYKVLYTYDSGGHLQKVENTRSKNGFEVLYDSAGRVKSRSDFNSKGVFGGTSFTYQNGMLSKQKYEQSGKPAEITEYVYDAQGRVVLAKTFRGEKLVRKETFIYEG